MSVPKDWRICRIDELSHYITSGSRGWAQYYSDIGDLFVRITNLTREKLSLDLSNSKYVNIPEDSNEGKRTRLMRDDILISITADLGITGFIGDEANKPAYINQHIALLRISEEKIHNKFVAYQMASKSGHEQFLSLNDAGAKSGLNLDSIRRFQITVPPLREQCRIAEILGVWDESIDLLENLITAKRKLKQGIMQQLLTGKKRFKEFQESEHFIVKISEVAKIRRGASPRPIQDPKWFAEKGRGWVRIRDVTASDTYLMRTSQYLSDLAVEKSVKVDPGDLIMSICATIGVPRIVGIPACIHDGFVVFREFEDQINKFFLYHYINFISSKISDSGQPGTQKNINTTIVGNIEIPKFSIQEQEKIAAVLSAADTEISTLEKQLAAYKEQKRGLMQQLLTGRTRILGLEDGQDEEQK